MSVFEDYLASRGIIDGMDLSEVGYDKIYFETNENLADMYKKVDFLDKDVLTVLASSDHFFLANYLGAKNVYSFDKNKLTLYYCYMRKWALSINKETYPFELLDDNYTWLSELLGRVEPSTPSELNAFKFWKKHLEESSKLHLLFHDGEVDGKTIFKSINSIGSVADRENNFLNINLFDSVDLHDKFDIAMISNIPEWAKTDIQMTNLSNNLYGLLRNNGIVLCSRFHEFPERAEKEKRIFEANFEFRDYGKNVGYCYIKK